MRLHVVLVEPAGALNVGSVARLCANFAVDGLRLVAPRCDPCGEEARRMAVHGVSYLRGAGVFVSLREALADCGRVVAASGRLEGGPLPLLPPAEAIAWLRAEAPEGAAPCPAALVFGREDRGLTNGELLQAGRLLHIPTAPSHPSLNLSHAVAVALHEFHRQRGGAPPLGDPLPAPCPRGELEGALADAEDLLLEVGFLLPHTARARMARLRALLHRAQVSRSEVALLRGMVCQLRWASRRPSPPGEDR